MADFKIDSKVSIVNQTKIKQFSVQVENVMNTAVLYSKTFKNYKKDKCPNDPNCIFKVFNGQEYFNNYILNTKGMNYFQEYKNQRNFPLTSF